MVQKIAKESRSQDVLKQLDQFNANVTCRVTNSLLKYVESLGHDAKALVEGLVFTQDYLSNPLNWVFAEVRDTMFEQAARYVPRVSIDMEQLLQSNYQ